MRRLFNFLISLFLLIFFSIPFLLIAFTIILSTKGPVFHWSKRIGRNNVVFQMPKFRTMSVDAPDVATHLLENPTKYLTPFGRFLRKFSLDELPQIWSVLKGDMTFVGPRPALYNQNDLIELRTKRGVHKLLPGITGWAQVNGRDNLSVSQKVDYDKYYMNKKTLMFDLKIIFLTIKKVIRSEGIYH